GDSLDPEQGRLDVDGHDTVELVLAEIQQGSVSEDTCVVDESVDSTEVLGGGQDHTLHVTPPGDIDVDRVLIQLLGSLLDRVAVDVGQHYTRAFPCEEGCDGKTYAASRAGDDRSFPLETIHDLNSSRLIAR